MQLAALTFFDLRASENEPFFCFIVGYQSAMSVSERIDDWLVNSQRFIMPSETLGLGLFYHASVTLRLIEASYIAFVQLVFNQ